MKKLKYYIGVIVAIIAIVIFLSDILFGIDLYLMVFPDDVAPEIDTSNLLPSAQLNGEYTIGDVTCTDNYDDECEAVLTGTIDTSVIGQQALTITATDESGNKTTETFIVTIIEGVDPSLYIPAGYYDALDGLSDDALINMLNDIIAGHTEYPYTSSSTDVWDIMHDADEDPENSDNVILFYTGISLPKVCQQGSSDEELCTVTISGTTKEWVYNREHIWSKSRGDFEKEGTSSLAKGAHTDLHHLVAAERTMNSTKNNRFFEDCNDGDDTNIVDRGYGNYTCNEWEFEPRDEVKGDVARMLFYMAIRYEGEAGDYVDLELVNDPDESKSLKLPVYGDLDDLLRWHMEDPVDEWEIRRNNVVYDYQNNRNPFIDMPDLAEKIWGKPEDYS